jgi:iron complex transport system substrate-binding protein
MVIGEKIMSQTLATKNTKYTKFTKTNIFNTKGMRFVKKEMAFVCFVYFVCFVAGVLGQAQPTRIISLVPNVTEMLFAIGAGPQVVAVSTYDVEPPEVRSLPTVGALVDPDTERIIALRPDLVITYGSQTDLQTQLKAVSIPFFDYRHAGLDHIMATMRTLGMRTGHADQAEKVASALEASIDAVKRRVAGKPRPRTLLVFGREPGSLRNIYASAGKGFLHDMLEVAGGQDVLQDIQKESAQISTEMILTRAPEVILELNAANRLNDADLKAVLDPWSSLSSVPAVKNKRVVILNGPGLTVPGPRVIEGIEKMARALHP